jgi:hypothetical protein
VGIYSTYVEGSLIACTPIFVSQTTLTEKKFESKLRSFDNIAYAGVRIEADGGQYHASMNKNTDKLQPLPNSQVSYKEFSSLRAKLLWVCTVRRNIL